MTVEGNWRIMRRSDESWRELPRSDECGRELTEVIRVYEVERELTRGNRSLREVTRAREKRLEVEERLIRVTAIHPRRKRIREGSNESDSLISCYPSLKLV